MPRGTITTAELKRRLQVVALQNPELVGQITSWLRAHPEYAAQVRQIWERIKSVRD